MGREGPADVLETIVELKNEFGIGNVDPEVQITAYYTRSIAAGFSGRYRTLFKRFLFPALGISLVGKVSCECFETLIGIAIPFLFRVVYWVQRSCTSRQTQIRRTHAIALGYLSLWR
jgi:hypothetical protein